VVLENDTTSAVTVSGFDLPKNSIGILVWPDTLGAGAHDRIAREIHREATAGIRVTKDAAFTTIDRDIEKRDGQTKQITVHYATTVSVIVDVTLTLEPGYDLVAVDPAVDDKVGDYIASLLVGDDVRRLRIFGEIDEIDGVDSVQSLKINPLRVNPETDLTIAATEVAIPDDVLVST